MSMSSAQYFEDKPKTQKLAKYITITYQIQIFLFFPKTIFQGPKRNYVWLLGAFSISLMPVYSLRPRLLD